MGAGSPEARDPGTAAVRTGPPELLAPWAAPVRTGPPESLAVCATHAFGRVSESDESDHVAGDPLLPAVEGAPKGSAIAPTDNRKEGIYIYIYISI